MCPADANGPDYCPAACSFFARCGIAVCDALDENAYVPLYDGCIADQCGQAGLICLQMGCDVLIGLARGVSMDFAQVCDNGVSPE